MKIHEYQARELLTKFGVPVPPAIVVTSGEEAAEAFETLRKSGAALAVVKAQVYAGGRGKGGGVKLVRSADEARTVAQTILSKPLVTPQTGPAGVKVAKLLVAAGVDIAKEYYLGMAVDRATGAPVLIASSEGGVEIEEVAKNHPDAILREPINPVAGLRPYQAAKIAYRLGFKGTQVRAAAKVMQQLADLFLKTDASLAEINPLVVTKPTAAKPDGEVLAIDAKINFDDNAMFRQLDIAKMADPAEEEPAEARAKKHNLSYIKLDGQIGCLVNGAGLAMATMDLIKLHGREPANFLDVGGSASEEAVTEAFRIILDDEHVKGVLVNIFGGIAKCDTIARAIITAAKQVGFKVPLVVRLEGTNVEAARKLLADAKGDIPTMQIGTDLTDAAKKITSAVAA
jgi:succinyl-CoA synthetase beta subunit